MIVFQTPRSFKGRYWIFREIFCLRIFPVVLIMTVMMMMVMIMIAALYYPKVVMVGRTQVYKRSCCLWVRLAATAVSVLSVVKIMLMQQRKHEIFWKTQYRL